VSKSWICWCGKPEAEHPCRDNDHDRPHHYEARWQALEELREYVTIPVEDMEGVVMLDRETGWLTIRTMVDGAPQNWTLSLGDPRTWDRAKKRAALPDTVTTRKLRPVVLWEHNE
jgi:hypothetical protein